MLNCPKCNRIIVDSTQEGGVKLRSRMIVFNGDVALALCPTCKTQVEVPLTINLDRLPPPNSKLKHFVQS